MNAHSAREIFAAWPPELKSALKAAAIRNHWQADDWPLQIAMCAEAMMEGRASEADLIALYKKGNPHG